MNDAQAIARLKRGDISGLEWLVLAYQTQSLRTAFLIVHDQKLAEDIVQSAFLKVYERVHQFDSRRPFAPWFYKIVANDAIKAARQQTGSVSLDTDDSDNRSPVEWLSTDRSAPEDLLERAETSEELWSLLQQLSPEQRAVLVLRYYADLTSAEIAKDFQIPAGTVRWRLHAALKKLRGLINLSGERTLGPLSLSNGSGKKKKED